MTCAMKREQHLLQVPRVARPRAAAPERIGILLAALAAPRAHGCRGDEPPRAPTDAPQCLHSAIARAESLGQPATMANDFDRDVVILIAVSGG